MNPYKAIFFDRDGTLTDYNPEKIRWQDEMIQSWSGKSFEIPYEKMMRLFILASEAKKPWYRNVEDEKTFFRRYYRFLLMEEEVTEDLENRAELLFSQLWCNNDRVVCHETVEVLEYFKARGYRMGVISDTSPSLRHSLEQLGLAKYFTSFTASSLVGAGKPSPVIFHAALDAQGVTAGESIFVEDTREEAEGAREQGFASFWLDRTGKHTGPWVANTLRDLVIFAESL